MAQNKTPRTTVPTSTTRPGGATTTTLRPVGVKAPEATKMVKITRDQIADIAGGLNRSEQVDAKSLENLRNHFAPLQAASPRPARRPRASC